MAYIRTVVPYSVSNHFLFSFFFFVSSSCIRRHTRSGSLLRVVAMHILSLIFSTNNSNNNAGRHPLIICPSAQSRILLASTLVSIFLQNLLFNELRRLYLKPYPRSAQTPEQIDPRKRREIRWISSPRWSRELGRD